MHSNREEYKQVLDSIKTGFLAARTVLKSLNSTPEALNTTSGISILSLKHHVQLSYVKSLVLLSTLRVLGNSITPRSDRSVAFGIEDRPTRECNSGDLIDSIIENRVVLEKMEILEHKLRYQMEKLVKLTNNPKDIAATEDPLNFKPNPVLLIQNGAGFTDSVPPAQVRSAGSEPPDDPIYHPPRLARMPYLEKPKHSSRQLKQPIPLALASLPMDPSLPHFETTSGLGGAPAPMSGRAGYLKRIQDFEEDNLTRLVMKKSEAKRRALDEEDLALGADLGTRHHRGRRRAGGLDDEFSDILRNSSRLSGARSTGDGYEELRERGKKVAILERSNVRPGKRTFGDDGQEPHASNNLKRTRFELEAKASQKKRRK